MKSLVITSSFSREGKTTTAVNLAIVLGQLGKRVLLVDADLHKPAHPRDPQDLEPDRARLRPGGQRRAGPRDPDDGNSARLRAAVRARFSRTRPGLLSSDAMSRFLSSGADELRLRDSRRAARHARRRLDRAGEPDRRRRPLHSRRRDARGSRSRASATSFFAATCGSWGSSSTTSTRKRAAYGRHYGYDDGYHGEEADVRREGPPRVDRPDALSSPAAPAAAMLA